MSRDRDGPGARARLLQHATPLEAALFYSALGSSVFPCGGHKKPLTDHGFHDASTDEVQIREWWRRWPDALIGAATGVVFAVLDVDVKYPDQNGFDTLEELGFAILPQTPMVHSPSGGLHLHFRVPDDVVLRSTQGEQGQGIGRGLDWRGEGGYIIMPSPNSAYWWDPVWNIGTVDLAPVPALLLPRVHKRSFPAAPIRPTAGLSPYAEAALDSAVRNILEASAGEQESTLNGECFSIGTLAGARGIPPEFARRVLIWAARQMRDFDRRRPWRETEIDRKVNASFDAGVRRPRQVRHD